MFIVTWAGMRGRKSSSRDDVVYRWHRETTDQKSYLIQCKNFIARTGSSRWRLVYRQGDKSVGEERQRGTSEEVLKMVKKG